MKKEYQITVEQKIYTVVVSDEEQALLAGKAAGRAVIAVGEAVSYAAPYAVYSLEQITDELLEDVVRRKEGLPWIIAETKRLIIREFTLEDRYFVPEKEDMTGADRIFHQKDLLEAYIKNQYGFYELGIWALEHKETGLLVGKAGFDLLSDIGTEEAALELGYHIFKPFRKQGYAKEACQAILREAAAWYPERPIYAKISPDNEASVKTAVSLGFIPTDLQCTPDRKQQRLFVWNC